MQILGFFAESNFLTNAIRGLFSFIDSLLYGLVSIISEGFFNVSNIVIFGEGTINTLAQRVYMILGIFMLFKLSFSLLSAVVNPDLLTDKERGMQKVIPRVLTMLIMLIIVPTVFSGAISIQSDIVQVIPALILGREADTSSASGKNMGESIAQQTFSTFVTPIEGACAGDDNSQSKQLSDESVEDIANATRETCSNTRTFMYDYSFFISSIVGIVLIFILLGFTIDIAIRSIKLGILQLLAPIPIISYIDPKSSKDGAFANWTKAVISTYVELFIKMGIMYFVMFVLSTIISEKNFVMPEGLGIIAQGYIYLFLILGLMFFAKQAPKFISDMFGIKGLGGGVGLAFAMGGAATLLGGGGLAAAGAMALESGFDAGDAISQGKAPSGAWSKGRDLAAQLKTGDPNAKGGLVNSLKQKALNEAKKRAAANLGSSADQVGKAKANKEWEEGLLSNMKMAHEDGDFSDLSGTPYQYHDAAGSHNVTNSAQMREAILQQENISGAATKKYEDMKKLLPEQTAYDKNRSTVMDSVKSVRSRYVANRSVGLNPIAAASAVPVQAAADAVSRNVGPNARENRAEQNRNRIDRR